MNQCILYNNLYIPNLLLFLVLVSIILYYIYVINFQKSVETFIDGCYTFEQNDMSVAMRKCGVYFIEPKKEKHCDDNFQYYDMTDIQIDYSIYEAENAKNQELVVKLNDIRNYLEENNYNKCTIDYTNAKELKQYFDDKYQPDTQNYIYPTKNINTFRNQVNYKLWNSCFINTSNLDYLSFNNTVIESCTRPLTRIIDVNDSVNKYLTFSFNPSINYKDIYNSICDKGKDKDLLLNIVNNKPFLSYNCEYKTNKPIKINDSFLISYDATVNNFIQTSIANRQDIQNMINNLFRLSYSSVRKRVVYGPRRLNMNVYLIYFDLCKNINRYSIKNINFSLRDFNVDDDNVNVPITDVPELIDVFDKNIKDTNIDTQQLMIKLIGDLIQDIENETKQIEAKKKETENEKKELAKKMIENAAKLKNDNFYQNYINNIINLRNQTDIFLYQYVNNIKNLRDQIDTEFNRQKALIGSSITSQENSARDSFKSRLLNENSRLLSMGNQLNQKIDLEYSKTVENLNSILITVLDRIRSYFKKNLYCSINFYNSGLFLTYTPRLEYEFTCMLMNMPVKESIVDIIDTTKNPTFHNNKYITNRGDVQYYVFELSGNILLDEGYYYFYIDVLNDEATDVFLGYPDPNNIEKMIFKNIANYYYANPTNESDYKTRKQSGVQRQNLSTPRNKTTQNPIYINGEYNNGYYGIYIRSLREIETIQSDYINIKYVRATTNSTNTAYDLFKDTFTYRTVNSINTNSGKNIRDQLYTYSNLSVLNNISIYYKYNRNINKNIYALLYKEPEFLLHAWNFEKDLIDRVQNLILRNNSSNNSEISYNILIVPAAGIRSLSILSKNITTINNTKLTANINMQPSFTWSFWAYVTFASNRIASIGNNMYVDFITVPRSRQECTTTCGRCSCETTCTTITWNEYFIQFMPFSRSIPAQFNKWYHFTFTYNNLSRILRLYIDGAYQFEIVNNFIPANLPLNIFTCYEFNNTVLYNDIRIHTKELTPFEVYCLYYKIVCPDTNPDPGIRKLEQKFYISCPKLPKPSEPPKKPNVRISYTPMTIPTVLNANSNSSYIPIYTQEKRNLNNFYNIDDLIDQLDNFRKIAFDDYNCMMKAEKQILTNSITQQSINNKQAVIERINDQIILNTNRVSTLNSISNSIRNFNRNYDYNRIKGFAKNAIIEFNTPTFYRYFGSLFKNVKTGVHHIYIELV